ncbi:MAG: DUF1778 domain-containing protein [Bacteroidota bacterium]
MDEINMTAMPATEMTRFDTRLTKEQKEFFEHASKLGGYRSLTEFILKAAQIKAEEIVEEHNRILASKRDQEIFFDLIFEGVPPNEELQSAFKDYNELL